MINPQGGKKISFGGLKEKNYLCFDLNKMTSP
jgi:hypothetical protein